jgi:hypothetical protein
MTLSANLSKFRSKIGTIKKESDNPFFKSKYADLPSILEHINPILVECGLSIVHATRYENESLVLETTLTSIEEKPESITSVFPVFGNKPQEIGSSMTYARRYNIQALLDLSTDDDDGNSANSAQKTDKGFNKQVDKVWFNEPDLKALEASILSGEIASKSALKNDFAISKAMVAKIQELIAKYPNSFTE